MIPLLCSDRRHDERKALPGWSAALGMCARPILGVYCDACYRAREAEAAVDPDHPAARTVLLGDGTFERHEPRVYDGEVVGEVVTIGKVEDVLTEGERDAVAAVTEKLRAPRVVEQPEPLPATGRSR